MAHAVLSFNEQIERIGEVAAVMIIGMLLWAIEWRHVQWWFVPLLLLIIRPVAVAVGLAGSHTSPSQRGLACTVCRSRRSCICMNDRKAAKSLGVAGDVTLRFYCRSVMRRDASSTAQTWCRPIDAAPSASALSRAIGRGLSFVSTRAA
jgi:hypothetical protein